MAHRDVGALELFVQSAIMQGAGSSREVFGIRFLCVVSPTAVVVQAIAVHVLQLIQHGGIT